MFGLAHSQVDALAQSSEAGSLSFREFERYLLIAHYLASRIACQGNPQLDSIAAKLSVSLLRHTDIIPADKAFYEAGTHCKVRHSYLTSVAWDHRVIVM